MFDRGPAPTTTLSKALAELRLHLLFSFLLCVFSPPLFLPVLLFCAHSTRPAIVSP
eukprot:m.75243 g.75243  ORF g.75243 m.75243 type:complete len:56 (-) comp13123_c6_seq2:737-904(-)